MKKWLWLALIPSLLLAGSPAYNMRKEPIYIDVHADEFILVAEEKTITGSELAITDNTFEQFMEQVAIIKKNYYILLLLQPGSEHLQQQLRQIIQKYDVDVGLDVWEEGREFSKDELMGIYETGTANPPKPDPLAHLKPYHVTLEEDRLILDKDNITVMYEELQTPGNPFEAFVDQCEANGGNPYIIPSPYTNPMALDVVNIMRERSPQMISNLLALTEMIPPPTPIEANTDGMKPVFFECRNNQLFSISPGRLKQALDAKTAELKETVKGEKDFLQQAAITVIELDGQRLDYTYALLGKYLLSADPNAEGYFIDHPDKETNEMWFGSQLVELDPETQYISFFVRPDSFDVFRRARKVVWDQKISSTFELLDAKDPIQIECEPISPIDFD